MVDDSQNVSIFEGKGKRKKRKATVEQTKHILVIMPVTDWIKVGSKVTSITQMGKKNTIQDVSLCFISLSNNIRQS